MDSVTFDERMYPSAYDYEDSASGGAVIVSEIAGASNLVFDAAIGTTEGYHYEVEREIEIKNTAKPASFDEGWTFSTDPRTMRISFDTMRIIDAKRFDKLVSRGTSDKGMARKAQAMRNMGRSIIREKARNILYGGQPAEDGTVNGKEISGFTSYLEAITDIQAMRAIWEKGERSPFGGEYGLTLDNQESAEYQTGTNLETAKTQDVWTSVYGLAWGERGCFTTYPSYLGEVAGYSMEIHRSNPNPYVDKRDGLTKMVWDDIVTGETVFGIGIKNRFAIQGLRNIYLGHKNKADRADEMYRVEQNLIQMYNFFLLGETNMQMTFYCSPFLFSQFEAFQKGRVLKVETSTNGNNGSYGKINTGRLQVADNIWLVSDSAFKSTEKFVSETVEVA